MHRRTQWPACLTIVLLLAACTPDTATEQTADTASLAPISASTPTPKNGRKTPAYIPLPAVSLAASEPPPAAVTTVSSSDGMHPVCAAYFDSAAACFAQAPEAHRSRLLASLDDSRAELQTADETACLLIQNQFDDWKQQVGC